MEHWLKKGLPNVVYRNEINLTCDKNTNVFINSLISVHGDTRKEAQFLKVYANHTMLTILC